MDAATKERLGRKWTCYSCAGRFYDLNKDEPICPKCSADQREAPGFEKKSERKRAKKTTKRAQKAKKAAKLPPLDEEEDSAGAQAAATDAADADFEVDEIDPNDLGEEIAGDAD